MASQDDDYIDAIFGDMDKNNDGRISSQELFQALAKNKNKPKNYEIQKMFDEIDSDQTGDIDYNEFKELASRWMHILSTGVPETTNFSNKRAKTRRVGVAGKALDPVTGEKSRRGMANEFVQKINREALRVCLEGWIRGDPAVIGSQADTKQFHFTWVPTGEVFNFEQFPDFYMKFKGDAEKMAGKYEAIFWNFIEHEDGDKLYNCAQWRVPGYDSGIYLMMAERGKLIFGKTTTAQGHQG